MAQSKPNWRDEGVRIVHTDQLDLNTPQTPGMTRAAAINHGMAGASFEEHEDWSCNRFH